MKKKMMLPLRLIIIIILYSCFFSFSSGQVMDFGSVMGVGHGESPWGSSDNDYYYDTLNPANTHPVITSTPQQMTVNHGDSVVLPCAVTNLGEYDLIWRRGTEMLWILQQRPEGDLKQAVSPDDRLSLKGTSLSMMDVQDGDAGQYMCEISTKPPRTLNHTLQLRVPPVVYPAHNRSVVTVKMGSSVTLSCLAHGSPKPTVTWSLKGRKLTRVASGNRLMVTNAQPEDNGMYECTADNGAARTAKTVIALQVMYPPKVRAEHEEVITGLHYTTSLACFVEAEPKPKVIWYRLGDVPVDPLRLAKKMDAMMRYSLHIDAVTLEDFGIFTCNATNYMGNSSAVIRLSGRPKPVRYFRLPQGEENSTYTLVWDVESYAPVLTYTISYGNASDPEEEWVNITLPGTSSSSILHSSSHTFDNLLPGATYHVHVTATNEFGKSDVNETFVFSTFSQAGTISPESTKPTEDETSSHLHSPSHQSQDMVSGDDTEESNEDVSTEDTTQPPPPSPGTVDTQGTQQTQQQAQTIRDAVVTAESSSSSKKSEAPTLTPAERRTQMGAFITAIVLSCFFF